MLRFLLFFIPGLQSVNRCRSVGNDNHEAYESPERHRRPSNMSTKIAAAINQGFSSLGGKLGEIF